MSSSNTAPRSAVKRFACDRCRDLKLRCPRELPTDESCARCVRACAVCVTSDTRPLGRPRISPVSAVSADTNGRINKTHRQQAAAASVTRQGPWQIPKQGQHHRNHVTLSPPGGSTTPGMTNSPAWPRSAGPDDFSDLFGSGLGHGDFTPADDAHSISSAPSWTQFDVADLLGLHMPGAAQEPEPVTVHPQASPESSCQAFESQNQPLSSQGMLMDFESFTRTSPGAIQPTSGVDGDKAQTPVFGAAVDPRIRLCQLNESIIQQLGRVESSSWRTPLVQGSCTARANGTDGNPLAQVMQSTSEMAVILQQLCASPTGPGSNQNSLEHSPTQSAPPLPVPATSTSEASLAGQQPDTSTVLLALSTWLRLIQLYNTLFTHAHKSLTEIPRDAIIAFRGPVDLRVPGLPGIQGDLYVKLMIQVIKHHLEKVEVLLGLPYEFRMWRRGGPASPGPNCLWNHQFSGLLPTVMKQMADDGGKTALRSLKDNISAMQDILQPR